MSSLACDYDLENILFFPERSIFHLQKDLVNLHEVFSRALVVYAEFADIQNAQIVLALEGRISNLEDEISKHKGNGTMGNYSQLPNHMQDTARRYVEKGTPGGSFFIALVEINLVMTFAKADAINLAHIEQWCNWLYWEAPSSCWGSIEKSQAWIKEGGMDGLTPVEISEPSEA